MSVISVYRFIDSKGQDAGDWQTQDFREADDYARKHGYSIMEDQYEYSDSTLVREANYAQVNEVGGAASEVVEFDSDDEETCRECGRAIGDDHRPDCSIGAQTLCGGCGQRHTGENNDEGLCPACDGLAEAMADHMIERERDHLAGVPFN